jgi:membrane protein
MASGVISRGRVLGGARVAGVKPFPPYGGCCVPFSLRGAARCRTLGLAWDCPAEGGQMSTSGSAHDRHRSAGRDKYGPLRLRVRALAAAARSRLERSSAQVFLSRLAALDFTNSIILFGSALLISVLPFVILLSSLANHRIDTDLNRHLGLDRQGAVIVSQLFRSSPSHSTAAVVTALILAAAGTIAVASSLQVIYERVFGQQHRGWKDVPRFATWAGVLFGVLVAYSVISGPIRAAGGPAVQGFVTYAGVAGFFCWTMHFLLAGRVPWRLLLRPALLTALFWIGLELFSAVYFSASVISDSRLYGTIGVVFSLMIWFTAIGAVIVLRAVAGATWNQHKDRSRRARA